MTKVKSYRSSPQYITEVWNGASNIGTVVGSGVTSKITYEDHDISRLGKGLTDVGGPMILNRVTKTYDYGVCYKGQGKGSQVAIQPNTWQSDLTEVHNSDLYGFGGTAIARTIPTNPAFSLTTEIADSVGKDAIPKAIGSSLWREKVLSLRSLGSEYLNVQFGWLPLVQDIHDVCHAVVNSHEILKKYHEGSGKHNRRGYHFPHEPAFSSPVKRATSSWSVNPSNVSWKLGDIYYESSSDMEIWFSGCFHYYVPVSPDQMSRSQQYAEYATKILGVKPTLETVWNAAPWSWAVDWAVNVGDVAHNISAFADDSLLLHYGYIMCHKWKKEVWNSVPDGSSNTGSARTEHLSEWKVRFPASPYGFGLTYDGLSSVQKTILAALGLSHQHLL